MRTDSRVSLPHTPSGWIILCRRQKPREAGAWEFAGELTPAPWDPHAYSDAAEEGQAPRAQGWKVSGSCGPRGR